MYIILRSYSFFFWVLFNLQTKGLNAEHLAQWVLSLGKVLSERISEISYYNIIFLKKKKRQVTSQISRISYINHRQSENFSWITMASLEHQSMTKTTWYEYRSKRLIQHLENTDSKKTWIDWIYIIHEREDLWRKNIMPACKRLPITTPTIVQEVAGLIWFKKHVQLST